MIILTNLSNLTIYVRNNTSTTLEKCTIEHTGNGGHPINLGTIKAMSNDTSEENDNLIFNTERVEGKNINI